MKFNKPTLWQEKSKNVALYYEAWVSSSIKLMLKVIFYVVLENSKKQQKSKDKFCSKLKYF